MKLGAAPITVTNAYNTRLQPILLSATTSSATLFSECFDFHLGIAIMTPSQCTLSAYSTGDNGNVYTITNNRSGDSGRTQYFQYDSLNRITQGESSGSQWGETYNIDAWGNLLSMSAISGKTSHENLSTTVLTNNQLVGYGYDTAGNMVSNGSVSYIYDAENRLLWTNGLNPTQTKYIYDGDGNRVEKCAAATVTTACPTSGTSGTLYWRGTMPDPQAETDLSGNVLENYIFFGGRRIARRDASTKAVHFYFSDHLGSHGVVENATGTACEQDIDYYPYGGQENDYCPNVAQHYKFTGKERDTESGLDNFGARYDASALGRFMTPDWAAKPVTVPYAKFGDPQTLNLYSYVENGPINKADADGHGDWYSTTGKKLGTDGVNDGSVVVVRDPKSVSYSSDHSLIDVAGSGIPLASFSRAEGVAMHDAVNRSDAPNTTDKTGGMHEEGFTTTAGKIQNAPAGPTAKPGDDKAEVHMTTTPETTLKVHVHPEGQGNTQFEQGPSTGKGQDLDIAKSSLNPNMVNAVVGAASGQVSIYNGQGVQAIIPLKAFPSQ